MEVIDANVRYHFHDIAAQRSHVLLRYVGTYLRYNNIMPQLLEYSIPPSSRSLRCPSTAASSLQPLHGVLQQTLSIAGAISHDQLQALAMLLSSVASVYCLGLPGLVTYVFFR